MSDGRIQNAIHSVFGSENVSIKLNRPILVFIKKPESSCIYLELHIYEENQNNIHVHALDNCEEEKKGRELLMLVEDLAQRIGSKQITLLDASRIKLNNFQSVSLKTLYILTTGQSWYNSLGYICLDNQRGTHAVYYKENKDKIITTTVSDFIEEVKHNTSDRLTEELIDKIFKEITEETHRELNPEMYIKDYFTIVKKILREGIRPVVHLLIQLLSHIDTSHTIYTHVSDCLLVKEMDTSTLIKDIKISGGRKSKKK